MKNQSKENETSLGDVLISKSRMSDQVKEVLKELVLKRKVGDRIPSEDEIARQLRVSKVTVRQALGNLEAQGLIERRRGIYGGNFVAKPTSDEMSQLVMNYYRVGDVTAENLIEYRSILEPTLARLAAQRVTEAELKGLKTIIGALEDNLDHATTPEDLQRGRAKALEFHVMLVEASQNPFAIHVMKAMAGVFQRVLDQIPPTDPKTARRFVDHARRLYQALERHDGAGAYEAMVNHFKQYPKRFKNRDSSPDKGR